MGVIQPIKIETHPLNNPYLDYSVYLNNMLIPGIFILLVMLSAAYTIGIEWKRNTQLVLYRISGRSPLTAIVGKLLPQTLVFWLIAVLYAVCFYRYLQFPCNSGILPMVLVGMLTVLAAQGLAVFLFGVCGQMRLSMCLCSLWGILSFSLAGFTFPVTAGTASYMPGRVCLLWGYSHRCRCSHFGTTTVCFSIINMYHDEKNVQ